MSGKMDGPGPVIGWGLKPVIKKYMYLPGSRPPPAGVPYCRTGIPAGLRQSVSKAPPPGAPLSEQGMILIDQGFRQNTQRLPLANVHLQSTTFEFIRPLDHPCVARFGHGN